MYRKNSQKPKEGLAKINLANNDFNFDEAFEEVNLSKDYELKQGDYLYCFAFEKVKIPVDKCGFLLPRSTFARMGLILPISSYVNPGYEGNLPIIIHNTSKFSFYIPPYLACCAISYCAI